MPPPSVPGSHAATNASDALICGLTHNGRPERNTATTGTCAPRSLRSSSRSDVSPGLYSTEPSVALELGVRIFAEHDDGHVRLRLEVAGRD